MLFMPLFNLHQILPPAQMESSEMKSDHTLCPFLLLTPQPHWLHRQINRNISFFILPPAAFSFLSSSNLLCSVYGQCSLFSASDPIPASPALFISLIHPGTLLLSIEPSVFSSVFHKFTQLSSQLSFPVTFVGTISPTV